MCQIHKYTNTCAKYTNTQVHVPNQYGEDEEAGDDEVGHGGGHEDVDHGVDHEDVGHCWLWWRS